MAATIAPHWTGSMAPGHAHAHLAPKAERLF